MIRVIMLFVFLAVKPALANDLDDLNTFLTAPTCSNHWGGLWYRLTGNINMENGKKIEDQKIGRMPISEKEKAFLWLEREHAYSLKERAKTQVLAPFELRTASKVSVFYFKRVLAIHNWMSLTNQELRDNILLTPEDTYRILELDMDDHPSGDNFTPRVEPFPKVQ